MELILASASPRRKEILSMLNLIFETVPADIDESLREDETPTEYVHRLSIEKAMKIAALYPQATVIGSDLTIDLDNISYAKAENPQAAKRMLGNFSNKTHYTRCGFAVIHENILVSSGIASTQITFRDITESELADYVKSEEWRGLAGAYGVQGSAAEFVKDFRGSYFDILGMPIYEIGAVLMKLGYKVSSADFAYVLSKDREEVARITAK